MVLRGGRRVGGALSLVRFHADWAWCVVATNAVAGTWALLAHWWPPLRSRWLWWFIALAEATIVVQVAAGVWLSGRDHLEAPPFHEFYGFVALISVGLIYSYRAQIKDFQYLLYGLGGLFLMGLALRAIYLAG